jgi:hypothetical protein
VLECKDYQFLEYLHAEVCSNGSCGGGRDCDRKGVRRLRLENAKVRRGAKYMLPTSPYPLYSYQCDAWYIRLDAPSFNTQSPSASRSEGSIVVPYLLITALAKLLLAF